MITSFEIENFRCFHQTKGNGFSNVNLFGGQNNIGKSALLEAIYLMGSPTNQSITFLLALRRIGKLQLTSDPNKAWDNFFYKQDKTETISFNFDQNADKHKVTLTCNEFITEFIELIQDEKALPETSLIDFANSLSNSETLKSSLHIEAYKNMALSPPYSSIFVASSNGVLGGGEVIKFIETNFIPSGVKASTEKLAKEFDKIKFEGKLDLLLDAFKIIDPSIEKVDTFTLGEPSLYVKRINEDFLPISLFGDAMTRIADFVLRIVNNPNSILLIDEIENGIHHTAHQEVWRMLFRLSKQYNVQIFATSHSAEMIEAFKDVIVENDDEKDGNYFELMRHLISNEIIIQRIPATSLNSKLNNGEPIRGEMLKPLKKHLL